MLYHGISRKPETGLNDIATTALSDSAEEGNES